MDSMFSNIEQNRDLSVESRRKKRRRIEAFGSKLPSSSDQIKWRSSAEQAAYSSKLVEALRHVCRVSSPASSASSRSRLIRETADKVLAIAARGRSRWSRAILAKRLKRQLKNHKKANKSNPAAATGSSRLKSLKTGSRIQPKTLRPLQQRVRLLRQLVPGCRILSLPDLLEETTDFIPALEMKVRSLAALLERLSGGGAGTSDRTDLT